MTNKFFINGFLFLFSCYAYFNTIEVFLPSFLKAKSFIFLILDLFFLYLTLNTLKSKKEFYFFGLFIVLSVFSQLYNRYYSFFQYINGFREFIPVFCSPIIIRYLLQKQGIPFIAVFNKYLRTFLFLQVPVTFMQWFKYGPGDQVGGTLGNGFSGQLSVIIFFTSYYLCRIDNIKFSSQNIKEILTIFFCWIPTFLNETKISFILIPLFFLSQLSLKKLLSSITSLLIISLLAFSILKSVYNRNENVQTSSFDHDYFSEYLYGDEYINYEDNDLPRFLRLKIGFNLLSKDFTALIVGKGLGHFKGGTVLNRTDFSIQNEELTKGSIIYLFFVMIQVGLIGISLIFIQIFKYFFLVKKGDFDEFIFYLILSLISVLYGTHFIWPTFCIVYFYIILSTQQILVFLRQEKLELAGQ